MKKFCFAALGLYVGTWIFNHFNPWIGIFIVLIVIYYLIKFSIKNEKL